MNCYWNVLQRALTVVFYAVMLSLRTAAQTEVSTNTADSVIRNTVNVVVVDVRTPEEYLVGHIENAKQIDFYDSRFIDSISTLPKGATIVVYSRTGKRSTEAVAILASLGYSRTFNMLGGFLAWKNEGRTITKGK